MTKSKTSPPPAPPPESKRSRKIPPDALPGIYERFGKGDTLLEICAWFERTYGRSITPTAIRKKLVKEREARGAIAQLILHEKVAPTVAKDLELLNRSRDRLEKLAAMIYEAALKPARGKGGPVRSLGGQGRKALAEVLATVNAELRAVIAMQMKLAGVDRDARGADEMEDSAPPAPPKIVVTLEGAPPAACPVEEENAGSSG